MSGYSREILLATSLLCGGGGAMPLRLLHRKLLQRCDISERDFVYMVSGCHRFLLVRDPAGDDTVVARTSLRLCREYGRADCAGADCQQLHLCKFFVFGNCRFGKGRKPCKYSHDVRSDHNYRLLRDCTLHQLSEDDLFLLLLQNEPTLLPEVCSHYNKGAGPHGSCGFQDSCTKVHLCLHFLEGDCMFGHKCKRQHAIDPRGRRMLEERGLSADLIRDLPFTYRNAHLLSAAAHSEEASESACAAPGEADDGDTICLHFIRNSCRFQEKCVRVHFHLPYKWEVFDGASWTALRDMEDIERSFCDPSRTHSSGSRPVDFVVMTQDSRPVRRLSTVSSVTRPPHYVLTTEWLWYYKGEQGKWVEYGEPDDKQRTTSVTSRSLEQAFQTDRSAEVTVLKGQRQYIISFSDMYQRNHKHNTKRRVRRRPRFVSAAQLHHPDLDLDPHLDLD